MARQENSFAVNAGLFFKKLVEEKGFTQEKFGDEFGVSIRTVRNWCNKGIDSLTTLQQVFNFFEIKLEDAIPYIEE